MLTMYKGLNVQVKCKASNVTLLDFGRYYKSVMMTAKINNHFHQ